jgi:hypothetical protein
MDENEAVSQRFNGTVALWYTSHHAVTTRDWDNIREFEGRYHPSLGYYKNDDPAVLRQHLQWMRRAGVDAIVYDCYGCKQLECTDMPTDRTLPLLMEELAHQEGESRKIQLIIWLEKYIYNPSLEQYRTALAWVKENLAEQPYYYQWGGRPLVVTYHNGPNEAIDEIEWENDYFALKRIRPYHSDVWSYVEHYPQRLGRDWMVVSPGFDPYLEQAYLAKYVNNEANPDLNKIREEGRKYAADRGNGEFFTKQLLRARQGDPKIIFISGWNDWQYANHIEPAAEYGCQYVDMAARLLGREAETAPYRD